MYIELVKNLHNYLFQHSRLSVLTASVPAYHFRVSSCSEFQKASQTAAERGKVELHLFNFKTTWSEIQKASQTVAEQGNAELHILDFKTVWSELQKPSQTATERGEAKLRILHFKTTWSEFQKPCQTATELSIAELCIHSSFENLKTVNEFLERLQ